MASIDPLEISETMKMRKTIPAFLFVLAITAAVGCKGGSKPDASGPHITSGSVDPEARPQKPSLGGSVEKPK
jgi:hypothetical protein